MSAIALLACSHTVVEGGSRDHPIRTEGAIPERDFLDTFGVNVHLNYTDGAYDRLEQVEADMRYLGLVHVRTYGGSEIVPLESYARLAGGGLRFNLIASSDRIGETVDFAARLNARVPGSVVGVEGFNEINNWPVTYGGAKGEDAARAAQAALYAEVKARGELKGVPVLYFTGGAVTDDVSGMADIVNVHAYSNNALQPRQFIQSALRQYRDAAAHLPRVNTEFGNFTLPARWPRQKPYWANQTQLGVDEKTQAKIVLNFFFEGIGLGLVRSYAYELLDQKRDPAGSEPEFHYGLFTFDHQPKASAKALHRLTGFLDRTRSNGSAETVEAELQNPNDSIGEVAIRREDGSLVVALWNRSEFWRWDQHSSGPADPPSVRAILVTGSMRGRTVASVFDPLTDRGRSLKVEDDGAIRLNVPDYPVLVYIRARKGSR